MKKGIAGLICFLGFFGQGLGQSAPKYSNEFLSIGVGGRAFGMSNCVVASTDDVTSGYWNPAGLVRIKDNLQLSFMHSAYLAGIANYDYGALGAKVGETSAIGFSFIRFGVDGIPNTLDLIRNGQIDYNRVTSFSAVDYAFLFSIAKKSLAEGLSFGGNAKIIHRKAGHFTKAWGFGVDAGMQYESPAKWCFGVMVRDVTSTFNAWSFSFTDAEKDVFMQTGNDIPKNSLEITLPKILLGTGKQMMLGKKLSVRVEVNADANTDGKRNVLLKSKFISLDPHAGIEIGVSNAVFLRAGIGNFQQVKNLSYQNEWNFQPNIGAGIHLKKLGIDYAFTDIGDKSAALYSNIFSIRLNINPSDNAGK